MACTSYHFVALKKINSFCIVFAYQCTIFKNKSSPLFLKAIYISFKTYIEMIPKKRERI